jgi:hypothetical protein
VHRELHPPSERLIGYAFNFEGHMPLRVLLLLVLQFACMVLHDLWLRIRDHLPKKGRGTEAIGGEPKLPATLEGALQSLCENYRKHYFEP